MPWEETKRKGYLLSKYALQTLFFYLLPRHLRHAGPDRVTLALAASAVYGDGDGGAVAALARFAVGILDKIKQFKLFISFFSTLIRSHLYGPDIRIVGGEVLCRQVVGGRVGAGGLVVLP